MRVKVAHWRWVGIALLGISGMGAIAWASLGAHAGDTLQLLSDKDAIRDKIALYSLLHDGDGAVQNGRAWADALWAVNASFQVIYPDGKRMFGNGETGLQGRETIFHAFGAPAPSAGDSAIRHVLLHPVFDSVTERTAKTRTVEIVIRGQKMRAATEVQTPIDSYIMHDTWGKDDDGEWRKRRSVVYCTVACPELLPPEVK